MSIRTTLFLLVSFLLIQCDNDNVSKKELQKLETAKETWLASKSSSYSFDYRQSCFCAFVEETRIVVVSDTVQAVLNPETGEELIIETENGEQPIYEVWPDLFYTIDELFDILEEASLTADFMKGEYDANSGVPITVEIDYYRNAIDDEVTYLLDSYSASSSSKDR